MAKNYLKTYSKKAKKLFSAKSWQESIANIILAGIIVVILGLLVANFFSKRGKDIDSGIQTTMPQETQMIGDYKVQKGDSLSKISEKYYQNKDLWPILARVNSISNPNIIYVDSTLKVPPKDEAEKVKEQMSVTTYKVKRGDTLFKISEEVYGNGNKWTIIAKANNVGKLPNGNPLIFAENTLRIPR